MGLPLKVTTHWPPARREESGDNPQRGLAPCLAHQCPPPGVVFLLLPPTGSLPGYVCGRAGYRATDTEGGGSKVILAGPQAKPA